MSKQTNNGLYDHIEFAPDEEVQNTSSNSVITDKENSNGFDVDWNSIEANCDDDKHSQHHRRRHHHSHHSSSHSSRSSSRSTNTKNKKEKKKWSLKKKIFIGILLFILCLLISFVAAFFIMQHMGRKQLLNYEELNIEVPDDVGYSDGGRTVEYNGHTYLFNRNIATILFMGIDSTSLNDGEDTPGKADALYLFTYDTTNGNIRVLCLNRDSMADITRYDEAGNYYDTYNTQLCLAYAYGNGDKLSAENQVTAVERFLYNVPINAYYAIDLSAIKVLNDDIGGVTLTPEYSFKSFTKGQQITIKGDMAEEFVRYRDFSILDDNLRRMACQRLYINSFATQAVQAIKKDLSLPLKLYEDTMAYTVTDIGASEIAYLGTTFARNFTGLELITTKGTYKMVEGDESAQFNVDREDLFEKVLDIFYIQLD